MFTWNDAVRYEWVIILIKINALQANYSAIDSRILRYLKNVCWLATIRCIVIDIQYYNTNCCVACHIWSTIIHCADRDVVEIYRFSVKMSFQFDFTGRRINDEATFVISGMNKESKYSINTMVLICSWNCYDSWTNGWILWVSKYMFLVMIYALNV